MVTPHMKSAQETQQTTARILGLIILAAWIYILVGMIFYPEDAKKAFKCRVDPIAGDVRGDCK